MLELEMVPFESQQRRPLSENNVISETYITSTAYTINTACPSADLNDKGNINDQSFQHETNECKKSNQATPAQIKVRGTEIFKTFVKLNLNSADGIGEDITDKNIHQTQNESENFTKEEIVNQKHVNLGFIQMVMSSLFYLSDNLAINLAILIAITINLLDGFGDVGLSFSLFWNGDIEGATILLSIDYLAVVLTVIHFSMTTATLNISSIAKICECSLLIILHPIAPSITMIFWLLARYKPTKNFEDHFHFLSKLVLTITATFEAPLQVIATTCLSLTGRIQTPWSNEQQLCDALGNCLPMGYFNIFVYCLSWLSLVKASIEAFQVGNKVTLLVFLLTTIIFRLSCFIGLATYSTFWSLLILIPLVFTNLLIVTRCSNKTHTGIHILTSVFCSIFVTTVFPEDPSKKEKTGESDINQDLAVYMATLLSFSNILIIFLGTLIVFLFVQFSPGFVVDPCIELDTYQLRFLFFCFSIPLFILSMMVTCWFYITQTETNQTEKLSQKKYRIIKTKIHDYRYVEVSANIFLFICLFAIILLNVLLCEKQGLKEKNNCFPRKQSNSSALGEKREIKSKYSAGIVSAGGGGGSTLTEVFIPSSGKSCRLPPLPDTRDWHSLNTVANLPVLCGGGYDAATQKSCLRFAPTSVLGTWKNYTTLIEPRNAPNGWSSDAGLIMMSENTTEIVPNGGVSFKLLNSTKFACSISLEASTIITGGLQNTEEKMRGVFQYNLQGLVDILPNLSHGRMKHGCGSYINTGQRVLVVVAGQDWYGDLQSTEKYVMGGTNAHWTTVRPLPMALGGVASASLDNRVFLLGGHCCGAAAGLLGARKEIYAYDGEDWNQVGELLNGKWGFAATVVNMNMDELICR